MYYFGFPTIFVKIRHCSSCIINPPTSLLYVWISQLLYPCKSTISSPNKSNIKKQTLIQLTNPSLSFHFNSKYIDPNIGLIWVL